MTIARRGGRRRDRHNGRPNKALERTAGSHSLAAAAHRRRWAAKALRGHVTVLRLRLQGGPV